MTFFSYGLDPARHAGDSNDFTGIVINRLDEKADVPKLQTLRKIGNATYPQQLTMLETDLFRRFPPSIIVVDYTNERTFTEILQAKGYRIDAINFTVANKLMLKQEGLQMLQQGYRFPDPSMITDMRLRTWVTEVIDQLHHEQVIYAANNPDKISFDHPAGDHNDLAIAWELSVHGILTHARRNYTYKIKGV